MPNSLWPHERISREWFYEWPYKFTINAHAITKKRGRGKGCLIHWYRRKVSHTGVCVCVCVQTNLWKYIYAFMLSVMCLLGKVNDYSSVLVPGKQDFWFQNWESFRQIRMHWSPYPWTMMGLEVGWVRGRWEQNCGPSTVFIKTTSTDFRVLQ